MKKLTVNLENKLGTIRPELHGQFIEVLGSCIYDGIWVGENSSIENICGIRRDFVEAMREIQPPLIRWPGGCYADTYHWRDGIGPKEQRPITYNENFGTMMPDDHSFGTHEFMQLCQLVGAKPWLNVNLLTGSVQEMKDWMEYCNRSSGSDLAKLREKNGSTEPFRAEYWGIGNEAWDGGGKFTAEGYANEYRRYSSAVPSFRQQPDDPDAPAMKLIISGPDGNKPRERVRWTQDLFRAFAEYRCPNFYGLDLHFYNWNLENPAEGADNFTKDDFNRVVRNCFELENVICQQHQLIEEGLAALPAPEGPFPAAKKTCALLVGEWGNWHAASFDVRPALWQQASMRDAITTALTLDIFHRNCEKISAACVAQTVNVLNALFLTDGPHFVKTPNYDVFRMYLPHRGAEAVECHIDTEDIYVFASVKDGQLCINLVNASYDQAQPLVIPLCGCFVAGSQLSSQKPTDCNTWEKPDLVREKPFSDVYKTSDGWMLTVPAASVTVLRFALD